MKIIVALIVIGIIVYFIKKKDNKDTDLNKTALETNTIEVDIAEDAFIRKEQSIAFCKRHHVPVNKHLPFIESEEETEIRTQEEVIGRTFALLYLGVKSEGLEQENLDELNEKYQIQKWFSPKELEFVNNPKPEQQDLANANWRYESMHVMMWALGFNDELKFPSEIFNLQKDVKNIFERSLEAFNQDAKLRTKKEILDQADLIYRLDWACVDARINGRETPAKMNSSIVYERHYALNWLINYMDSDWDDVSTDT